MDVEIRNHNNERTKIAEKFTVAERKEQAGKWTYQLKDGDGEVYESGRFFKESDIEHV
jgi:hypothetical protein